MKREKKKGTGDGTHNRGTGKERPGGGSQGRQALYEKEAFIDFMIDSGALRFGEFRTKSGRMTPYFINTGKYDTGAKIHRLSLQYAAAIEEMTEKGILSEMPDVLLGPAYKGIPLAVSTAASLWAVRKKEVAYCFNREEEKDHGEQGIFVGHAPRPGEKILIVEDVITAGTGVRDVMKILRRQNGVTVSGLLVSVDRMEIGVRGKTASEELWEEFGIKTYGIVNIEDILEYVGKAGAKRGSLLIPEGIEERIRRYMEQYCRVPAA